MPQSKLTEIDRKRECRQHHGRSSRGRHPKKSEGGHKMHTRSAAVARGFAIALLLAASQILAPSVRAQLAPAQPIKIIVGVPAGGLGDLAARIFAQRLTDDGNPTIV